MARKKKEVVSEVKTTKGTIADFDLIIEPIITEKTMTFAQEGNKYAFKVSKDANKIAIRNAISRIYGVHVEKVTTINVAAKKLSRGSRYHGTVPGYKKAIVTLKEGEAINLFSE